MEFEILIKKINHTLSEKEAKIFDSWYNDSAVHRAYFNRLKNNYSKELDPIDVEKAWIKLSNKLPDKDIENKNKKNFYWKYAVVAAIVLFIAVPFAINQLTDSNRPDHKTSASNIQPGSDKAILTLEDGSQISLDNNSKFINANMEVKGVKLSYNKSLQGNDSTIVKYNFLTIPRGGQYFVELSDGTQVWLNSETQLKYPVNFIQGKPRTVELVYGEAYFNVSPSSAHNGSKFRVFNGNQEIKVLGTQFNVKAYKDEFNIYTTLVEGEISLTYAFNNFSKGLKPNQQSVYNLRNNSVTISEVIVFNEISWRDGIFSFEDKTLMEIMKVLSRWYDMDVEFKSHDIKSAEFIGVLSKNQNLEEILTTIKSFGIIEDYKIDNKKVVLK